MMRRPTRRLALSLLGVLWLAALLLFFFGARRKLEAAGAEERTPEGSDVDWDDLWDQFEERRYLSARRWKGGEDPYRLHAFNQRESERIPSDRAVRDTRHHRCTTLHYRQDLPSTSVIITFHNEARSTLLRTIRRHRRAHMPRCGQRCVISCAFRAGCCVLSAAEVCREQGWEFATSLEASLGASGRKTLPALEAGLGEAELQLGSTEEE